ncbi:hypothetical protein [Aureimonas leprariae]|nr:hypothetical protein [Aureimonas leprariae]
MDDEDPYVAVVIVEDGVNVNWKSLKYRDTKKGSETPWWARDTSGRWRTLISSGKPVLLRRGMDEISRTAGPKIGLFMINALAMNEESLEFSLVARVGECA